MCVRGKSTISTTSSPLGLISCMRDLCLFIASLIHLISYRYIYYIREAKLLNVDLEPFWNTSQTSSSFFLHDNILNIFTHTKYICDTPTNYNSQETWLLENIILKNEK